MMPKFHKQASIGETFSLHWVVKKMWMSFLSKYQKSKSYRVVPWMINALLTLFLCFDFSARLARLSIYFKEHQFITSKRSELYGLTDFLGACGGLLGLFMVGKSYTLGILTVLRNWVVNVALLISIALLMILGRIGIEYRWMYLLFHTSFGVLTANA